MKYVLCTLLLLHAFNCSLSAQPPAPGKTVIRNVNLISIDAARPPVMHNADVFIEKGKIRKIKPSGGGYKGYTVIDGSDKYLVPGMADMHAHLPRPSSTFSYREYNLLNLMNGVTTVRQMRGKPSDLLMRDSILKGAYPGCQTYISTPPFFWDSKNYDRHLFTAVACKDSFTKFREQGYDFIKYVGGLSMLQYDTLIDVASSLHFKVAGHAPNNDFVKSVAANQISVEHMTTLLPLYEKDSALFWNTIDKMVQQNQFHCPDLRYYIMDGWQTPMEKRHAMSGVSYIKKERMEELEKDYNETVMKTYNKNPVAFSRYVAKDSADMVVFQKLLPRMYARGLKLLVSPADGEFFVPGFSFIDEMELLTDSGISPYETLKCATYNAAECMGDKDKWGSITENKRADMVLLSANPLDNIDNLRKVEATIINGNVLTRDYLANQLKQ